MTDIMIIILFGCFFGLGYYLGSMRQLQWVLDIMLDKEHRMTDSEEEEYK